MRSREVWECRGEDDKMADDDGLPGWRRRPERERRVSRWVGDALTDLSPVQLPGELGRVVALSDFELDREPLTRDEMREIAETALTLLRDYYAHLRLKRKLHAAEPLQRLELLRRRLARDDTDPRGALSEDEFHLRMSSIFTSLRDCHALYYLPRPYRTTVAFLPFLIDAYVDDGSWTFVVTATKCTFTDPDFRAGVTVTHWNGTEIARAVERNADANPGANRSARLARGLDRLTFRWMSVGSRPSEDWVVITYDVGGELRDLRFPWLMTERPAPEATAAAGGALSVAQDPEGEWIRRLKTSLYFPDALASAERRRLPDVLRNNWEGAQPPPDYGYLRIYTFDVDPDELLTEVRRLLETAPEHGLIIDIRNNPGGILQAGEQLLQLLTPREIDPITMHFRNCEPAVQLARAYSATGPSDIDAQRFNVACAEAINTASTIIPSPLAAATRARCNEVGQRYQGPVVLLVDALTYSTGDVFAAGFRDHEIGPIVGSAPETGAGGGNVWGLEDICRVDGGETGGLPGDASFTIPVRTLTRPRRDAVLIEDLGVSVDHPHDPTREDVVGAQRNRDLIAHAYELLEQRRSECYRLRASYSIAEEQFVLDASDNLRRVDVFLGGDPLTSVYDAVNGHTVPVAGKLLIDPAETRFYGYVNAGDAAPAVAWRVFRSDLDTGEILRRGGDAPS